MCRKPHSFVVVQCLITILLLISKILYNAYYMQCIANKTVPYAKHRLNKFNICCTEIIINNN